MNTGWRTLMPLATWLRVRGLEIADDEKRRTLGERLATDEFSWELTFADGDELTLILIGSNGSERLALRERQAAAKRRAC
jgi:hypothetical protein